MNKNSVPPTIRQAIAAAEDPNAGAGYRVLMKTGTLDPDEDGTNSKMLLFVVGRWRAMEDSSGETGQFVPGQTVTGYIHMEDAGDVSRYALAREVLPEVIEHVSELDAAQQAASDAS